jgi:hypothetical protein
MKAVSGWFVIFLFALCGLLAGGCVGAIWFAIVHGEGGEWQQLGQIVRLVAIVIGAFSGAILGAVVGVVVRMVVSVRRAHDAENQAREWSGQDIESSETDA